MATYVKSIGGGVDKVDAKINKLSQQISQEQSVLDGVIETLRDSSDQSTYTQAARNINKEAAIAIGLAYKRGQINLEQAIQRMVAATGLSELVAERMFRSFTRTNCHHSQDKK